MKTSVVIVGAGPSGLGAAIELATTCTVTIVDRIPVVGGETGWQDAAMQTAAKKAKELGVEFHLGCTALRWADQKLLVASPTESIEISADALFFAGGLRPATSTDIGITGDRPAGVVPATVALHLLQSGAELWGNAVVVGDSHWAQEVTDVIHEYGGRVASVVSDEVAPKNVNRSITNASNFKVRGLSRVETFECVSNDEKIELSCDAVILAGPAHPNRNVEGALLEPSENVVFVQPTDVANANERFEYARKIAHEWFASRGDN